MPLRRLSKNHCLLVGTEPCKLTEAGLAFPPSERRLWADKTEKEAAAWQPGSRKTTREPRCALVTSGLKRLLEVCSLRHTWASENFEECQSKKASSFFGPFEKGYD